MAKKRKKTLASSKKNKVCEHCNEHINGKTKNSIKCILCEKLFHVDCTSLDSKQFNEILKNKLSWSCNNCKITEDDKSEISAEFIENNKSESSVESTSDDNDNHINKNENNESYINCIRCSIKLKENYQKIFDESGKELDLQKLLSLCFDIDIKEYQNEEQGICSECLNDLIETYDLIQKEVDGNHSNNFNLIEEKLNKNVHKNITNDSNDSDNSNSNCENTNYEIIENDVDSDDTENEDIEERKENTNEDTNIEAQKFENVLYLDDFDEEFDFNEYRKKIIKNHKFNEIQFPEPVKCSFCMELMSSHIDIINHITENHFNESTQTYYCCVDVSCQPMTTKEDLSFHLVLKHYSLDELIILCVCPECKQVFENFQLYNKHSCNTAKQHSRAKIFCELCDKFFKSNKRYRFHLQFHLGKRRPKACLICDKMFRDEDEFFEHIKYDHEKEDKNVCKKCDSEFTSIENLQFHLKTIHVNDSVFQCLKCFKTFSSAQYLKNHLKNHDGGAYKCHICGKCLTRKSRLNKHILQHKEPDPKEVLTCNNCGYVAWNDEDIEEHLFNHGIEDVCSEIETLSATYVCEFCENTFKTVDNLLDHRKTHSNDKFECPVCNVKYSKYSALAAHKISHNNYIKKIKAFESIRYFVCGIGSCKKVYRFWSSLNLHKTTLHRVTNSLQCPKCNLNFETQFEYKEHINTQHIKGTIFVCEFCSKSFKSQSAKTLHIKKIHSKLNIKKKVQQKIPKSKIPKIEKKLPVQITFPCTFCPKLFKSKNEMRQHLKTDHHKEPKFSCSQCSYKTPYKQTLTYHLRTHSNEYLYQCSICFRKFRFKNAWKLHEEKHVGKKKYVCEIDGCNMSYINLGRLKTHQKFKHDPNFKKPTKKVVKMFANTIRSDVFIDDDDGLSDFDQDITSSTSQNENCSQLKLNFNDSEEMDEDVDGNLEKIFVEEEIICEEESEMQEYYEDNNIIVYEDEINKNPVIVRHNDEHIIQIDNTKLYTENIDEPIEVGATEIIGE